MSIVCPCQRKLQCLQARWHGASSSAVIIGSLTVRKCTPRVNTWLEIGLRTTPPGCPAFWASASTPLLAAFGATEPEWTKPYVNACVQRSLLHDRCEVHMQVSTVVHAMQAQTSHNSDNADASKDI